MTTIAEPVFGNIPLTMIRESATNPRKYFDQAKLEELANSIRLNGVGQPILVRPHPDKENHPDCVELVAGARRFRASKLAERETIPAIVRDMSDIEVSEFQLVENLQREDMHEIEEAEGYGYLMSEFGMTADQVAEKVGKSRSYIFGRLKLLSLDQEVRKQFFSGGIDASTALLIARIPVAELQIKAATEIQAGGVHWNGNLRNENPLSYRQAKDHLQARFMLKLVEAPFDINCPKLNELAGTCSTCPNNTGNQPDALADVGTDICTDPDCFATKKSRNEELLIGAAKTGGIPVLEGDDADNALNFDSPYTSLINDITEFGETRDEDDYRAVSEALDESQLPPLAAYLKDEDGLTPLYNKDAIEAALVLAGIILSEDEVAEKNKERTGNQNNDEKAAQRKKLAQQKENMAKQHTAFKNALYDEIRNSPATVIQRPALHHILSSTIKRTFKSDYWDRYGLKSSSSDQEKQDYIDSQSDTMLIVMTLDSMFAYELHTGSHQVDDKLKVKEPAELIALARSCEIDVDAFRNKYMPVDVEKQKKQPAKPKSKKSAKVTEVPLDDDSTAAVNASEPPAVIQFDDVVRVKDDARGPNRKKRKTAGKIGVVVNTGTTYYHVKFGHKSHELVTNLTADELEKTEDQGKPSWWPKPEQVKPADAADSPAAATTAKPKKSKAKVQDSIKPLNPRAAWPFPTHKGDEA